MTNQNRSTKWFVRKGEVFKVSGNQQTCIMDTHGEVVALVFAPREWSIGKDQKEIMAEADRIAQIIVDKVGGLDDARVSETRESGKYDV